MFVWASFHINILTLSYTIFIIRTKITKTRPEEVFVTTVMLQDTTCTYPENRKAITSFTSQWLIQYMRDTYKWNVSTLEGKCGNYILKLYIHSKQTRGK